MTKSRVRVGGNDDGIEKEIRAAIGARIAELRRKRKLTARLVGEKLKISREAVTQIENGRNNITALAVCCI